MESIQFKLEGKIVPKARPRLAGRAYTQPEYKDWMSDAVCQLYGQLHDFQIEFDDWILPAIHEPVDINIVLSGKHNRKGDLDNVAGSILDALVKAEIIRDDNMSVVVKLNIEINHNTEVPETIIRVKTISGRY